VLLLIFRCVHSAVTPGESRFKPHCNGTLAMGINAKLRRDINSPDFSTCLLLIQFVWVAVDITSYHSLNRVDIKSHNHSDGVTLSVIKNVSTRRSQKFNFFKKNSKANKHR